MAENIDFLQVAEELTTAYPRLQELQASDTQAANSLARAQRDMQVVETEVQEVQSAWVGWRWGHARQLPLYSAH